MQVVNVHLCRSHRTSVFSRPVFSNGLITAGIVAEIGLILVIDHTATGNRLFGTAPLAPAAWLAVLPFAIIMLVLDETRKAITRSREGVVASAKVREGARYRTSGGHA
jgi:hypothetical protein